MESKKEFNPTASQNAAMNITANRILVSAAAGSGKSTVLTNRIINAIINKEKKYDLQKLMVVTFTRASAEDLKAKITKAIKEAIEDNPDDKHLSEQLMKLPAAKINTIHGVCSSLIKGKFDILALPASVSIADENAVSALKIEIMNELLEYCYSGLFEHIPDFEYFVENFITERDDKLNTIFLDIYDKMKNQPNSFKSIDASTYSLQEDFLKTEFGNLVYNRITMFTEYYIDALTSAIDCFGKYPTYNALIADIQEDINFLNTLQNAVEQRNFVIVEDVIKQLRPTKLSFKLNNKEQDSEPDAEIYREVRKNFTTELVDIYSSIFSYSPEQLKQVGGYTEEIAKKLLEFMKEFDKRYSAAKQKRSYLDFNDLEHYTLKLLYKNGEFSNFAHEYSSGITEIFVDEYQDLNPLQHMIFDALSVHSKIFMVGDIKQSIYGFRGADPQAFRDYKRSFPEYQNGVLEYKDVTVFLSENFRSSEPVINFANTVSDALFYTPPKRMDDVYKYRIPYSDGDKLKYSLDQPPSDPEVKILNCICPNVKGGNPIANASTKLQAQMVANEIKALINSGANAKDIAIIYRKGKANPTIFEQALKRLNISVNNTKGAKLFDTPEIQLVLALINCCENPYKDIHLAGALKSPVFGFTLEELIQIRDEFPHASSLYEAFEAYTSKYNAPKCTNFMVFLTKMRKYAMENTVDRFLWYMYTDLSLFSVIYDGTVLESAAESRRANLLKLHELAKSMTDAGKSTLYTFVERIRLLIEQDESPNVAETVGDGVRIMTFHASKGLEFKYCFVCGLSQKMENKDLSKDIIYDGSIGFATKIKDNLRLTTADTPYRVALSYKNEAEWIDEEMRMLYVAMTRAQTKLYLCSSIENIDAFISKAKILSNNMHPYLFIKNKGFMKWLLLALGRLEDAYAKYPVISLTREEIDKITNELMQSANSNDDETDFSDEELKIIADDIKSKLEYEYPHKSSLSIPSKLAVSVLHPEIFVSEGYEEKTTMLPPTEIADYDISKAKKKQNNKPKLKAPIFTLGKQEPTGAEKGTATHIFMQFCDFENLQKNGVDTEIKRLINKGFILPEHSKIINKDVINTFLKTDIFGEMINSPSLQREYRFNIKLPAAEFAPEESIKEKLKDEFVFVQGVIDCYFRDNDGNITLLDYKTDYVPENIKGNTKKENDFFIERYKTQLTYYRKALNILTGTEVKRTVIFSFALGRCIEI